jgi:protein tyrosine/serine phosphatase
MKRALVWWIVIAPLLPSCARMPGLPAAQRPAAWAQPLHLDGVPNLHRVAPNLYRSAQPSAEGMRNLERAGIRTVVNLRYFHSDNDELRQTSLRPVHLPTLTWTPDAADAAVLLELVSNAENGPVLVHCAHGADRTGAVCALARIHVDGWPAEAAVAEMLHGGFGFHCLWRHLPGWVARHAAAGG